MSVSFVRLYVDDHFEDDLVSFEAAIIEQTITIYGGSRVPEGPQRKASNSQPQGHRYERDGTF